MTNLEVIAKAEEFADTFEMPIGIDVIVTRQLVKDLLKLAYRKGWLDCVTYELGILIDGVKSGD